MYSFYLVFYKSLVSFQESWCFCALNAVMKPTNKLECFLQVYFLKEVINLAFATSFVVLSRASPVVKNQKILIKFFMKISSYLVYVTFCAVCTLKEL